MESKRLTEYFTHAERVPGRVILTDDAPQWLQDAVKDAHDDEGPNDWRYEICQRIVGQLAEYDFNAVGHTVEASDIADSLTDVYTSDLLAWVAGHIDRVGQVDEAHNEAGVAPIEGIVAAVRYGQFVTIERMAQTLIDAIAENTRRLIGPIA